VRPVFEKALGVSVGEGDWGNAGVLEFQKEGMLADDFQQGFVGETLFVITEQRRGVNAGKNSSLAGCALGPAFNPETGIRCRQNSIERDRRFILEHGQRRRVLESVKRIRNPTRTDA
jgi:hypothetical protein